MNKLQAIDALMKASSEREKAHATHGDGSPQERAALKKAAKAERAARDAGATWGEIDAAHHRRRFGGTKTGR